MRNLGHYFMTSMNGGLRAGSFLRLLIAALLGACGGVLAQGLEPSKVNASMERAGEVVFVAGTVVRESAVHAETALVKGALLQQGDRIRTRVDGFVYIRMADGGLLVVRPQSALRIDQWRFDPQQPQNSEIKYTLDNGVARYVSGRGSQAAKDKFRFNTPLAAIGVRGTDFTVLAESLLTRVVVRSGGVVVSRLGAGCSAETLGPCEGEGATELFATAREKMVQLRQGDLRPELVDANSATSPDKARPPAPSEPVASRRTNSPTADVAIADTRAQQVVDAYVPPNRGPDGGAPSPHAAWGRYSVLTGDVPASTAMSEVLAGRNLVAVNRHYVLASTMPGGMELPGAGSADFKLLSHEGIVLDKQTNTAMASVASNGSLRIDFAARSFTTGFDLQAKNFSTRIEGYGSVASDGTFLSRPFLSPTLVQGLVGGTGASEAAFIYQRSVSSQFEAAGVTAWGK